MDRTPDNERKNDTTKTSAGISKSLLTPCRRVGLTRNRKSSNPLTPQSLFIVNNQTPTTETPKTKRTKLCKNISSKITSTDDETYKINLDDEVISTNDTNESINFSPLSINVSTQLSPKSDEDSDSDIPLKMLLEKDKKIENANPTNSTIIDNREINIKETLLPNNKEKNGNSATLSKRCISAISKKMMKQPTVIIENIPCENVDDDFVQTLITTKKANSIKKLEANNKLASKDKSKTTLKEKNDSLFIKQNSTESSTCKVDDDDFAIKKTILVRKSYNKELSHNKVNLIKAKSTGTITTKDIEEINLILQRKQQALAQKDLRSNEDLENLIVKWRNGCQIALGRLLTLMKERVPEKANMEMEELLKMLNIPVSLVKYNIDGSSFD